ncbi:MAG: pilus assembly protein PilM [Planctomycetota bacterium]
MAKSCGIHIGQRRFAIVVLDGSAKKNKVVFQREGDIPPGEDPILATAQGLKEASKGVKVPGENIGLAVDSGLAAYRTLNLPFDDKAKIEDVVKFEVESQLPQWDIDEVIVDFLTLSSTPGVESNLLITAVPKDRLEARIRACERAGLEPYEAELDTTALFNAAEQVGLLGEDGAQVLVHVGDASTSVVVVDGGRLHAMRSVHSGAEPLVAAAPPPPSDDEEEDGAELPPEPEIDPAALAQRRAESASRLRRELARTLSAANTDNPVEGIFVTGLQLPELFDGPILDVEIRPFDGLPGEGDDVGECAVAYGAALRRLGGGSLKGTLRREELRYTGKFERLELPLAVLCLLLVMSLWVHLTIVNRQILWRGEGDLDRGQRGDLQIWLEASNAYMLPSAEDDYPGVLTVPPEEIAAYCQAAASGSDLDRTKMQELRNIERLLTIELDEVNRELGRTSEVEHPQSALEALTTVLELVNGMGDEIGRVGLRQLASNTAQTKAGSEAYVQVKMDMDFFAEADLAATRHYNNFANALEDQPWCRKFERKQTKVLDGGGGIYVDGLTIEVDTTRIERDDDEQEQGQ